MVSKKKGYNKKPRRSKSKVPSVKAKKGKGSKKSAGGSSFSSKLQKGMGMGKNILGNLTGMREAGKIKKMLGGSK